MIPNKSKITNYLILTGVLSGGINTTGFFCIKLLNISDATALTQTLSLFTGIMCYYFLNEVFTKWDILSTIFGFIAVVLIAKPSSLFHTQEIKSIEDIYIHYLGVACGIRFCIMAALNVVIIRSLKIKNSVFTLVHYQMLLGIILPQTIGIYYFAS